MTRHRHHPTDHIHNGNKGGKPVRSRADDVTSKYTQTSTVIPITGTSRQPSLPFLLLSSPIDSRIYSKLRTFRVRPQPYSRVDFASEVSCRFACLRHTMHAMQLHPLRALHVVLDIEFGDLLGCTRTSGKTSGLNTVCTRSSDETDLSLHLSRIKASSISLL